MIVSELKRICLSTIHNVSARIESKKVNAILDIYDGSVIQNKPVTRVKTVTFIITRMVRFHGGQTSVLRLGTRLCEQGFDVYYVTYKKQSLSDTRICAASNLKSYRGTAIPMEEYQRGMKEGTIEKPDVVVATSWDTVSVAKRFDAYLMYFVQDYEPYFYKFGEEFMLSRSTYEQGLHMVSLGAWNKDMIERECKPVSPLNVISFPCERSEYPYAEKCFEDYSTKRKLTIAVYLKYYGKRMPNLIPRILEKTAKRMAMSDRQLEVKYFGEAKTFKPKFGKNLGHLSKKELAKLYREADFGMVASMSNISLVPYEMLSSGLPVFEFEEGTFKYFFPQDCAILINLTTKDLAEKIFYEISHPEQMKQRQQRALKAMEGLGWDRTGAEFAEILRNIPLAENNENA